jgi:hypothetical protein
MVGRLLIVGRFLIIEEVFNVIQIFHFVGDPPPPLEPLYHPFLLELSSEVFFPFTGLTISSPSLLRVFGRGQTRFELLESKLIVIGADLETRSFSLRFSITHLEDCFKKIAV